MKTYLLVVTGICCRAVCCSFLYGGRSWAAYTSEPSLVIVGVTSCVCAMLKLFIVSCVVSGTRAPGVWATMGLVHTEELYLALRVLCGGSSCTIWGLWVARHGGATSQFLSACCEADPTRPSVWPAGIAGMWDTIRQDHVFRSWPLKDPGSARETVMLSSGASCVEFLTDALIVRCDCSTKSVFFVFTVLFSRMTGWLLLLVKRAVNLLER